LDLYGILIVPSLSFGKFEGSTLVKDDTLGAATLVQQEINNNNNPYTFTFNAPTIVGFYYA